MPEHKTYTAYYQKIPLNFWFYFWIVLFTIAVVVDIAQLIWPPENRSVLMQWLTPFAHAMIFYSVIERCYKQYQNSKANHCFISVNETGISWRLPEASYKVKEKEIIVWQDIKKVILDEHLIIIKYMSTYFTDSIPLTRINEQDKEQLFTVLREQLSSRSIVSEDRLAA